MKPYPTEDGYPVTFGDANEPENPRVGIEGVPSLREAVDWEILRIANYLCKRSALRVADKHTLTLVLERYRPQYDALLALLKYDADGNHDDLVKAVKILRVADLMAATRLERAWACE